MKKSQLLTLFLALSSSILIGQNIKKSPIIKIEDNKTFIQNQHGSFYIERKKGYAVLKNERGSSLFSEENEGITLLSELIIIQTDGKMGAIDYEKNTIFPFSYDLIQPEGELILIKKDKQSGLFNTNGKEIIPMEYDTLKVQNGHIIVEKDDLLGLYDLKGNLLLPPNYDLKVINDWIAYHN